MKTILVPTDFSENAENALWYAIELAKRFSAKIIVLNSYYLPHSHSGMLVSIDELLVKESKESLTALEKKVKSDKRAEGVSIETVSRWGEPDFAIGELIDDRGDIDLVIMGTQGAGNVAENIIGSVTTSAIKSTSTPILVIPDKATFKDPERIVFAVDHKDIDKVDGLDTFREFASKFGAKLLLLHIYEEGEEEEAEEYKTIAKKSLNTHLMGIEHVFYSIKDDNIIDSINDFVKQNDAEVITMIARKRSLIERIFHKSATKRVALHSKTPLFVLHDNSK